MNKKTIAVLFGGHSSEYSVSLHSAHAVLTGLNTEKYDIIPIGITREGDWYRYCGDPEKLMDDTWADDPAALIPTVVSPNRSVHGILEFPSKSSFCPDSPDGSGKDAPNGSVRTTRIDFAFPVLHGKCGEDGTVQGVFELAGIPVIGCGTLSSALCMDKDRAHRLAALAGIAAPKAVTISCFERDNAAALTACLTYPLFVKPVRAGSSYGISRISGPNELSAALDLAFSHDSEVIIEENVEGFEVGCAVVGINELFVGRVDEIELDHGFFDYAEKYERASAVIHMPARIDPADWQAEYYRDGAFAPVEPREQGSGAIVFEKGEGETWQYFPDFSLGLLVDGEYQTLDLTREKWEGGELRIAATGGDYRVITDNRLPNGSIYAGKYHFHLSDGETKRVRLQKHQANLSEMLDNFALDEFQVFDAGGQAVAGSTLTRRKAVLLWLEEGMEPTEHILNEMLEQAEDFRSLPADIVFLVRGKEALENAKLKKVLEEFPAIQVYYDSFVPNVETIARRMYVDHEKLPLIVVTTSALNAVYACSGYNVGSGDMIVKICNLL